MKRVVSFLLVIMMILGCNLALADERYGNWQVKAFVDEFDLPTNEYYAVTSVEGHFSNSATSKSKLGAVLFFMNWSDTHTAYIEIRLFEYGNTRVSNYSSKNTEYYDVLVMDTEGNKVSLTGRIPPQDTDMIFYNFSSNDDNAKLVNILTASTTGTVRFSITERDNTLNKYVFAVDVDGLKDACDSCKINMKP